MGSLSNDVLSDARQLEVDFLESWAVILNEVPSRSWYLVSIRIKTLSNTNLVTSRHIKRDEDLFQSTCVAQKRRCLNSLMIV